jgi:hypothetical protein
MTDWARRVYAQPYYAEGKTHAVARIDATIGPCRP